MTTPGSTAQPSSAARRALLTVVTSAVTTEWRRFGLGVTGALLNLAALLTTPLATQRAIDQAVVAHHPERLPGYLAVFAAIGAAGAAGGGIRRYCSTTFAYRAGAAIRDRVLRHALSLELEFHDQTGAGELMSRLSSDVTMVEVFLSITPFVVQTAGLLVAALVVLPLMQRLLGAVAIVALALGAVLPLRWTTRMRRQARHNQERVAGFTAFVEQQIGGVRVIKGHGLERRHHAEGARLAMTLRDAGVALARAAADFSAAMASLPGLALVVAMSLGGWLAWRGAMSPGHLFSFVQYELLLLAPIQIASHLLVQGSFAGASAQRLLDVEARQPRITSPVAPRHLPADGGGAVHVEMVRASYVPGQPVLDDVDLHVAAGTSLALVGGTGSGKTTLLRLLPRLRDVDAGRVTIDGVDVRELDLAELRGAVASVIDDAVVFSGSVRENLLLGRGDATDAEVWDALQRAAARDFVAQLPDGLDTEVGERGVSISGGQRQRLALARALLRGGRVLLLDDPTSALDPDTAALVHRAIAGAMRERTTIVATHHPELLEHVDQVALLHRGRVLARGTHAELLDHPAYRRALALDAEAVA